MNRSESAVRVFRLAVSGFSGDPRAGVGAFTGGTADEHFDWFKVRRYWPRGNADWRPLPVAPGISEFYCARVRSGRRHCRDVGYAGVEPPYLWMRWDRRWPSGTFIAGVLPQRANTGA